MDHLELCSYVFYSATIRALSAEEREDITNAPDAAPVGGALTQLVGIAALAIVVGIAVVRWI